jgi:hypothetical protein
VPPDRCVGVLRDHASGSWEVEITDRPLLLDALGEPLVIAFCRCFVHADRLAALASLAHAYAPDEQHLGITARRNIDAVFWFAAGSLLELQEAVAEVGRGLHRSGISTAELEGWSILHELSTWRQGKLLRRLRNKMAFHIDAEDIRVGLRSPIPEEEPWLLARGESPNMRDAHVPFGTHPLLVGLQIQRQDMGPLGFGAVLT